MILVHPVKGFYKGFIALDDKSFDTDYHFIDKTKVDIGHKPGATSVINVDASGKLIKNPLKANRKELTIITVHHVFSFVLMIKLRATSTTHARRKQSFSYF